MSLRKAESELDEGLRLGALLWPGKMAAELRRLHEENEALRQALAQPEQECTCSAKDMPFGKCCKAQPEQKREWVGLSDEEIYDYADKFLYQHGSNYGIRSFGKAIEAKLKEKNT